MKASIRRLPSVIKTATKWVLYFTFATTAIVTLIVQTSGDEAYRYTPNAPVVNDVTKLNPISVAREIRPLTIDEIVTEITGSSGPISVGGGRYSQGGQTAYPGSLHIDMRGMNKILGLKADERLVTVQAGITWRQLQSFIDDYDLSVKIMQTYANFTVGGSLSVNVHGRYIGEGAIVKSVESIKLVLADGSVVNASRNENPEIFRGAIGGYGGLGVIVEATLKLAENSKIERTTKAMKIGEYRAHFFDSVRQNSDVVLHNADIYPPKYEDVLDVTWLKTDKPLTSEQRIIPSDRDYFWGPKAAEFVANYDIGKLLRQHIIDPFYYSSERIVWRNWEASYDIAELEPTSRERKTYVLREYFVPVEKFDDFVPVMKEIFVRNDANIINVSIRHAFPDTETLLSWSEEEVFAFVVYYQQGTDQASKNKVKQWSLEMIDAVLSFGGSYYLPYQIFATSDQFSSAYPQAEAYFALKDKIDPENRFTNMLWAHHYPVTSMSLKSRHQVRGYDRSIEQTFLTIPEWYLVFNPLEYADFLQANNNPSDFPFYASIDEYWTLYDRSVEIGKFYGNNPQYMTMLRVIGISTTAEYMFKGAYENTIGRLTRWLAGGKDTEEDLIIQQAHRAYSDLIFDEAWYMFDFSGWVSRIWRDTTFFGGGFLRKIERKLFFTMEFGFKSFYAKLIGYGAQTAYEPSEKTIYLTADMSGAKRQIDFSGADIIKNGGHLKILGIGRWGEFTKTLPLLAAQGVQFNDISGNSLIAATVIVDAGYYGGYDNANVLFDSRVVSDIGKKRLITEVKVKQLTQFIMEVQKKGQQLEHIYDY